MSLLRKTKSKLQQYQIIPRKRLGQNFMVESTIFQRMAEYASLSRNDVALDIGAGMGFLTRFLAAKCMCVLAVESDARLVKVLREELKDLPNVKIFKDDVLEARISQFNKVVSIPPYYISSSVILWLFNKSFECAVLIFQKEFANRLIASVGVEDYGWLTVVTYYYVEVELLDDVPKWMFYPQPEVDSVVVRLKPRAPPFKLKDAASFRQFVQTLFRKRNRKVKNAVLPFIKSRHLASDRNAAKLADSIPFREKRVRELAPEDFGALINVFTN